MTVRKRGSKVAFAAVALLGTALALGNDADAAKGKDIATASVDSVKPGDRGHAVTVFFGETSDKFEIEVVDTVRNYLPKQDAVLFRSTDPRLEHSGIVGGMSGSPIFVGGKLVGALSYGWRFNKDPLGALTPIGNMLEIGELPYRPEVLPHPPARGKARRGTSAWADQMLGLKTDPLPARRTPEELEEGIGLTPLALPLSVSGLGPTATRMLGEHLDMIPVRGGSGGKGVPDGAATPKVWQPGDSVSVVMVRGDSSVASNGTVTWVGPKGQRLLAFGHSMFEDGPSNLPIADARVHTIIASVERSVKMSSPLTIQGVMYQDRQPAIALRTDLRAPMIPMTTTMQGPDPDLDPRVYENEIAVGVDLTPNLAGIVLAEAVDEAGRDAVEVVVQVDHEIAVETSNGPRTVKVSEEVFFPQGLIGRIVSRSRGVIALAAMLDNDFEVATIRHITQNVTMKYGAPVERIENVRLLDDEVRAGDLVRLELTFRAYKGKERTEIIPLRIPDDAGGEEIQVVLTSGDTQLPYRPLPKDLDDIITTIEQSYPSRSLVATIYRQAEGLSTRHGLINDMPDSVMESLIDRGSTRDSIRFKQMARRVIPTKKLIEGEHTLKLDVLQAKNVPSPLALSYDASAPAPRCWRPSPPHSPFPPPPPPVARVPSPSKTSAISMPARPRAPPSRPAARSRWALPPRAPRSPGPPRSRVWAAPRRPSSGPPTRPRCSA